MTDKWICFALTANVVEEMEEILEPGVIKSFLTTLPDKALHLGLRVLLAVVFFLVGTQLIKLFRKIIRKSMKRANAETGAVQFVDSFVKAALYVLLVLTLASSFGVDAASLLALLGSAGVAIGRAVQGSLSNLAGGGVIRLVTILRKAQQEKREPSQKFRSFIQNCLR